jgi:hypothetical protein
MTFTEALTILQKEANGHLWMCEAVYSHHLTNFTSQASGYTLSPYDCNQLLRVPTSRGGEPFVTNNVKALLADWCVVDMHDNIVLYK